MKRILNQLLAFLVSLLILTFSHFLSAQNTSSKTGIYLQEIKKDIAIPGENEPEIIRLLNSGNDIVAISKDKIFRYNGKKWNSEKLDFQCITATTDSKGNVWLGGNGFIFNLNENKRIELPIEASNDTLICLLWENEKTMQVGTCKGLWTWNGNWSKVTETNGISVNQITKGEGQDLWLATSNGLFQRKNNQWINSL